MNRFDGSYVHVVQPIGEVYHSRCTADVFEPGVLTISSLDEPDRLPLPRVYGHGEWTLAEVFMAGQPAFGFWAAKETA
jgi:hypothetical protein